MQLVNKDMVKKTFTYTWYLYPIALILIILFGLWGFYAFHIPTAHESLTIFLASQVNDVSFKNVILGQYPKEKLRAIDIGYVLPSHNNYATKLNIFVNEGSDLLILPKNTLDEFGSYVTKFFVPLSEETINKYLSNEYTYYQKDSTSIGVLVKQNNVESWLDGYMTFEEGDYYLVVSQTSKNADDLINEKNKGHDNALTAMKYFINGANNE